MLESFRDDWPVGKTVVHVLKVMVDVGSATSRVVVLGSMGKQAE